MNTKKIVLSSIFVAFASILSTITLVKMPFGGSSTPFSMLFVVLVGFFCGKKYGLLSGLVYGFIQAMLDPQFYYIPQIILDYGFAFMGLGFGALVFTNFNDKFQIHKQYVVGVFSRYIFVIISGAVFFGEYAPEEMSVMWYSITYNATYIIPEAIITIAVLCIPQVRNTIVKLKHDNFPQGA